MCTLDVLSWDSAVYKIESMINFEEEGLVSLLYLVNVFWPISPLIVFPNVIIWCLIYLMYYPKCHNLVRKIYDLESYVFRSCVIWRWKTSFSHGPSDHFWTKKKKSNEYFPFQWKRSFGALQRASTSICLLSEVYMISAF